MRDKFSLRHQFMLDRLLCSAYHIGETYGAQRISTFVKPPYLCAYVPCQCYKHHLPHPNKDLITASEIGGWWNVNTGVWL
jgi:hypothetical protein